MGELLAIKLRAARIVAAQLMSLFIPLILVGRKALKKTNESTIQARGSCTSTRKSEGFYDNSSEEEQCRRELQEMSIEHEEDIDPAELCEMDWEDDPFEWVQFKNEGIPHLRADEDDLDCYDIEDMGLDPNFYMGDGNNF